MNFLSGYKTYIGIALLFILGGLRAVGYINDNTYQILLPMAGGFTAYGIRKAIN